MTHPLEPLVTAAYADRALLAKGEHREAVLKAIAGLDDGTLRVAEKGPAGWTVNAWVKEAMLLYFAIAEMKVLEVGPFEFHDKVPLKKDLAAAGRARGAARAPCATARYVEPGAVVMPGYVNIGARVGRGDDGGHLGHRRLLRPGRARTCTSRAAWGSVACSSRPRRAR